MATNLIGTAAGRDFSTITAWESALQGTLTEVEFGDCKDDSDFNEQVTINGSTTNSTAFFHLITDARNRHKGVVGEGVKMDNQTPGNDPIISVRDPQTRIEGFLITASGSTATVEETAISTGGGAGNSRFRHNIIYEIPNNGADVNGISTGNGNIGSIDIQNSIFYAIGGNGVLAANGNVIFNVSHCTLHGCSGDGLVCGSGDIRAANNISFNNTGSDYADIGTGEFTFLSKNNMSSDDTADDFGGFPGTNIVDASGSAQFVSVEKGSEDFHLNPTASAKGAGNVNELLQPVGLDIDGQDRRRWDMGADEERIEVRNYVLKLF